MGLLDKAKQQAGQLVQKSQEVAQKGQEKLQEAQAKKREDALLRDLGAAVYAERRGRATPDSAVEIERLVNELRSHETAQGSIDTTPKADQQEDAAGPSAEDSATRDDM